MGIVSAEPLLAPLDSLPGVGPALAARLKQAAGGGRVADLLLHLPERHVQRLPVPLPSAAPPEREVRLAATVLGLALRRARSGTPYVEARCAAGGEALTVRFLNGRLAWLQPAMPAGRVHHFAGVVRREGEAWTMLNPLHAGEASRLPEIEPVWPLVAKLSAAQLRRAMAAALMRLPELPEWADAALLRREGWPGFAAALRALHQPERLPERQLRDRLAYDELLAGQVAVALLRHRVRAEPGRALAGAGHLRARALAAFGHALTPAQQAALAEIDADLAAPRRMLRLLQGDVGTGKTIVALLAMLRAVEAGGQAALMAPTELLARQHHRTLAPLAGAAGVEVALLTGALPAAERRRVQKGLARGDIPLVVGTHALFQKQVGFADLALAVVDEQHRFGVAQRMALADKGAGVDVLAMTATPIPRTLLLTRWGEIAVTRLGAKPAGRQPVATGIVAQSRLPEVVSRLEEALRRGERAYWVVRAIAGGEHDDSVAAEDRFAELSGRFPGVVGLAHGEQDIAVREAALGDFAAGRTRVLVATTVVEVGVDVPDATIMIIEQAERFGLSALHQLRGRVGRGRRRSACLLVHSDGIPEPAQRRLMVLRDTEDGFAIAEADLEFRGGGDALGARQAGREGFRIADPAEDPAHFRRLLEIAHDDARLLLARDPGLASPRGAAVRALLEIFGHDASMGVLVAA